MLRPFLLLLCLATVAHATMMGNAKLDIDFTNEKDAAAKVEWPDKEHFTVAPAGLGWDGGASSSRDFHFITQPVAIGWSWRPTSGATLEVKMTPAPEPIKLDNGQIFTPFPGMLFVRYSPDLKNWSSWQEVSMDYKLLQEKHELSFQTQLGVPNLERKEYVELLQKYMRMDVPWGSDENAAVKWILTNDPAFFQRHIPFIGYIQFLYENTLYGNQHLKASKRKSATTLGEGNDSQRQL